MHTSNPGSDEAGPIMITRTIQQYARSGVAALHIEDQVQTKRCGHLQGKQLVSTSEFLVRIRAAVAARHAVGSDIVIIARTDALQSLGYSDSIARLRLAREAGADVGFLEGITNKEEARVVVRDLAPWPILLNMVEHGATPSISVDEAQEMGFRIVIFPFAGLAPAYKAMREVYQRLKTKGVTGAEAHMTPKQLFEVSGLKGDLEIDVQAGGTTFAGGV
jgi:2-methylisocitrate lyase-like PEP mutase family enzyme